MVHGQIAFTGKVFFLIFMIFTVGGLPRESSSS